MSQIVRLVKPIHQLRWRLTLSYTAVSMGALLVSILIMVVFMLSAIFIPYDMVPKDMWVQAVNKQAVPISRMLLSQNPRHMQSIADFVNYSDTASFESLDLLNFGNVTLFIRATADLEMFIFDSNGVLLGRTGFPAFSPTKQIFDTSEMPGLETPLRAALEGQQDSNQLVSPGGSGEKWVIAVPVMETSNGNSQPLGVVVYVLKEMPTEDVIVSNALRLIGFSTLLLLISAGFLGTIFGSITARDISNRLQCVLKVTDAWSKGDFSEFINDPIGDEISKLAVHLNNMAEQLQHFFKRNQEMAVSEERNRLARDLHDSAKQEALAASFHLGTAVTLFERDSKTAKSHLVEAENLVDSVRGELTDLIHELRPPTVSGINFDETLNEFIIEWAHQTGIEASFRVEGFTDINLEIKQTIYRIMQEALANIARHSYADNVEITLDFQGNLIKFCVIDDGVGFNPQVQYDGIGLDSMRERVESMNGDFSIDSDKGCGVVICVILPFDH